MQEVILVIHLIIAIGIVITVLLQRSEGGALGIGGGGGGGMMSARGATNLLTRTTAVLAACFFATSIILTILAGKDTATRSIMDAPVPGTEQPGATEEPELPALPQVPMPD